MSWHSAWAKKQTGNPVLLLVAAAGFTFSFWGFFKYAYKPWANKKRFNEAESYADYIFTKENSGK